MKGSCRAGDLESMLLKSHDETGTKHTKHRVDQDTVDEALEWLRVAILAMLLMGAAVLLAVTALLFAGLLVDRPPPVTSRGVTMTSHDHTVTLVTPVMPHSNTAGEAAALPAWPCVSKPQVALIQLAVYMNRARQQVQARVLSILQSMRQAMSTAVAPLKAMITAVPGAVDSAAADTDTDSDSLSEDPATTALLAAGTAGGSVSVSDEGTGGLGAPMMPPWSVSHAYYMEMLDLSARDERVLDSYTHDEVAARIAQQMEEAGMALDAWAPPPPAALPAQHQDSYATSDGSSQGVEHTMEEQGQQQQRQELSQEKRHNAPKQQQGERDSAEEQVQTQQPGQSHTSALLHLISRLRDPSQHVIRRPDSTFTDARTSHTTSPSHTSHSHTSPPWVSGGLCTLLLGRAACQSAADSVASLAQDVVASAQSLPEGGGAIDAAAALFTEPLAAGSVLATSAPTQAQIWKHQTEFLPEGGGAIDAAAALFTGPADAASAPAQSDTSATTSTAATAEEGTGSDSTATSDEEVQQEQVPAPTWQEEDSVHLLLPHGVSLQPRAHSADAISAESPGAASADSSVAAINESVASPQMPDTHSTVQMQPTSIWRTFRLKDLMAYLSARPSHFPADPGHTSDQQHGGEPVTTAHTAKDDSSEGAEGAAFLVAGTSSKSGTATGSSRSSMKHSISPLQLGRDGMTIQGAEARRQLLVT